MHPYHNHSPCSCRRHEMTVSLPDDEYPAFSLFHRDRLTGYEMPGRLEVLYFGGFNGGVGFVDTQPLPIDIQVGRRVLLRPGCQCYHRGAGFAVYRSGDIGIAGLYRAVGAPVADHLCPLHPKIIPGFPDGPWVGVVRPGHAVGHAVDHPPPGVATALQHFAHQAKGDAAHLDEKEIGRVLFIIEIFPKPEPAEIGEMLHVEIGAVIEAIAGVVLICGVQIDDARVAVFCQHAFYAFHSDPIEGDIIEIDAVDADILHEPVHAFDVVVVPSAHAAIDHSGVFYFRDEPGGDVVVADMFLQPGKTFARSGGIDLIAQAAEGEGLVGVIGELAHGVIDLYLQAELVGGVDIAL